MGAGFLLTQGDSAINQFRCRNSLFRNYRENYWIITSSSIINFFKMHVASMSFLKVHNPRTVAACKGSMESGVSLDSTNQPNTIYLQLLVVPKFSLWGYFESIICIIARMRTEVGTWGIITTHSNRFCKGLLR